MTMVIYPDVYISPLYMDHGKVSFEQCTESNFSDLYGCQYVLNLPKNWFPMGRYILDHKQALVRDADLTPVGESGVYVDYLLTGKSYVPEGNVSNIMES